MLNLLLLESDSDESLLDHCLKKDDYKTLKIQHSSLFLSLVKERQPDLIIINLATPSEAIMADLQTLNQHCPVPVIVFAHDEHPDTINRLIKADVCAYVIGHCRPDAIDNVINVARARFNRLQQLKNALEEARTQLEDRKQIDRAKAILIKTQNFTENEAYHTLRKLAMDRNITLGDMAKNVIAMADLLK